MKKEEVWLCTLQCFQLHGRQFILAWFSFFSPEIKWNQIGVESNQNQKGKLIAKFVF